MKCLLWSHNDTLWGHGFFIAISAVMILLLSGYITPACRADDGGGQAEPLDFTSMSLEELKQVMIISILKKPQNLSDATSAISVITQDDIRRSGATNIPDLLRCLPGIQVAQINSNTWAVSARGFNHRFSNKLLILMDGRCLYTPLFSGVYWNVQDTVLEDIERIEVIRGPGATLWGANAVNGVINIITKKARDTQGGLIVSGAGNKELGFNAFRYGARLADNAYGRIYLKYFMRDGFVDEAGNPGNDDWNLLKGGGRLDWSFSSSDSLTVQGDMYNGKNGEKTARFFLPDITEENINIDNTSSGFNLLSKWKHTFSRSSDMALQLYYDRTKQDKINSDNSRHRESFDVFDLDFQHNFSLNTHQEMIWGFGYRFIRDHFNIQIVHNKNDEPHFFPKSDSHDTHIVSTFLQDSLSLIRDRLQLTAGSKFEYTEYNGFQFQPSIRILYKITKDQNIWTSVSRALRTEPRYEHDIKTPPPPGPPPSDTESSGSPPPGPAPDSVILFPEVSNNIKPEELIAYELGYRIQPVDFCSFDSAVFYNDYDNLIIDSPDYPGRAESYGVELAANWDALKWWTFRTSYTYLHIHVSRDRNFINQNFWDPNDECVMDSPEAFLEKTSPRHQWMLRSSMDLSRNLEFDLDFRYVSNLGDYIKSYREMDARLGWSPVKNLELSIVGRNLLDNHHSEFVFLGYLPNSSGGDMEVERSIYGKITCRF
ncbi:MAG: TonB-dependent receptor [bacterium]